ncbi:MAG: Hvo_1808 family surface protein [Halobacterium sp.]
MPRRLGVLALVAVVLLAGCGGATPTTPTTGSPTTTTPGTPTTTTVAPVHPPGPAHDVLGWEGGYWYNETLSIDQSDGLNDSELHAVVNRSMARDEYIRGLEFEQSVPVEVVSRAEHRNRTNRSYGAVPENDSLHQNTKFEALFFMGENTSAIQQEQQSQGSNVLGYYSPGRDRIVIVSENGTVPKMDERTLSQELFHALQEHRFNVSQYHPRTEETHNALDGIIEGDANYVEDRYREHCSNGWQCVTPPASDGGGGGGGGQTNVGLLALRYQPYSDGPPFVADRHDRLGWEGVDSVYDAPPESTEQTIHPEKYRSDHPTNVTVRDTSDATWSVPDLGAGSIDYASFGEAGMFVMFWYPSQVESQKAGRPTDVVVPYAEFFAPSRQPGYDRYDYTSRYSAGWDGDKLYPYVTNDSAATNQTGYVWKSAWDSPTQAAEFVDGYDQLLRYHGAVAVDGHPDTYHIPEGEFADAFYVHRDGDRVVVVNAPTVEDLSGVRAGAGVAG